MMMDSVKELDKGHRGLYEYFYTFYHKIFHPDIVLITSQGNKLYVNKKDTGVAQPLINGGIFDRKETEVIMSLIKPGMTVVDVGANLGYFTLIAAKLVGDQGRVYAFEPQPDNYRLLTRNIRINGYRNIVPINMAMSNKPGKLTLFVDEANLGAHSLSNRNLIQKAGSVEVETTTMDNFFNKVERRIDFVKTDAQGAEGLIFDGAKRVLNGQGLKMIIEFWPWGLRSIGTDPLRLLEKLMAYGFCIKAIDEADMSLKKMDFVELIKVCDNRENGWGYFNLLMEKIDNGKKILPNSSN
jgi:FkbM family methyltransferase